MSRKSSIIFTYKYSQSIEEINTKLTKINWAWNKIEELKCEILQTSDELSIDDIKHKNFDILIKNSKNEIQYHFYVLFLSESKSEDMSSCFIVYQYGDETREFFLNMINDNSYFDDFVKVINADLMYFSYEGDGDLYNISIGSLEKCFIASDYTEINRCMIYPVKKYQWLG